ncbi:MAG: M1 family metallopeptidase, partial [Candidatus Saccharibacteria bacterium]
RVHLGLCVKLFDFASHESLMALRRDCLDGVQAVQIDVHHPDEISTLFDGAIVYAKGARLLRMLQHYIGNVAFQTGLRSYFNKHAYSNTDGEDLWNELSSSSSKDIAGFMNTWISQPGYPVVNVSQTGESVSLSQTQFFTGPHEPSDKLWPIPLNSPCTEMPVLFDQKEQLVTRHHMTPLRLNDGDTAHFITHYDDSLLLRLIAEIKNGSLSPLDRLQLLHEQTMLARGGIISSASLIPLLDAFADETNESVWEILGVTVGELKRFVEDDEEAKTKLRQLAGNLARAQYQRLGWDMQPNETETDTKLRATILGLMIYSEDDTVLGKVKALFASTSLEKLDPELRPLIISAAVRYSDDPTIVARLMEEHASTSSAELQGDIAIGVTSTKDITIIKQLLGSLKNADIVRVQDVARWFVYLVRGKEARELTWQWLRDNWDWIDETFSGDKSYDDYVRYPAIALSTRNQLEEYKSFFTPKLKIPALTRVIGLGIAEIESRVELIERDGEAVRSALRNL